MIKDYTNNEVDPRQEQISASFVRIITDIDKRLDRLERRIVRIVDLEKKIAAISGQIDKIKRKTAIL